MTRDEILGAGEAELRRAIRERTGKAPLGRRTVDGLRILAARAYGIAPEAASPDATDEAALSALPARPAEMSTISVRVLRDYWPVEGDRLAAGTETRLAADIARPLVRAGVVEWI